MNDYDYVVLFDENGQPYIAHSAWDRAKQAATAASKRAHKYIERIGDRYFYTQDELKAYYNNMRGKANRTASGAKDLAKKLVYSTKTVGKSAAGKINETTQSAVEKAKSSVGAAKEKARDSIGYDEFDRYERAWQETSDAKKNLEANPNDPYARARVDRAEAEEAHAHDEYLRTPLGRARDAVSRLQEFTDEFKDLPPAQKKRILKWLGKVFN